MQVKTHILPAFLLNITELCLCVIHLFLFVVVSLAFTSQENGIILSGNLKFYSAVLRLLRVLENERRSSDCREKLCDSIFFYHYI